jgi:predicted O-methyltransferase YrrM
VRALDPASVLEIGTHIGTSLVHIASALKRGSHADFELETVDIWDVNDPGKRHWEGFGSTHSPREMLRRIGCADRVEFFTRGSIEYLKTCKRKFDFIFLDGEHAAAQVYQEVPASLKVLNDGGYILMHDVFPDMKPLWSNGRVIRGPFQAIERLQSEGCHLGLQPLGALPWPTKLGSNVTSLALLGRP